MKMKKYLILLVALLVERHRAQQQRAGLAFASALFVWIFIEDALEHRHRGVDISVSESP